MTETPSAANDAPAASQPQDVLRQFVEYAVPRLISGRRVIGLFILAALVCGLVRIHFVEPYYEASVTLGPGGSSPESGPEQSGLSALSSLTGITGPATKLSAYDELQQVLLSNDLVRRLSNDEDLLALLYPGRRDPVSHTWKPSAGVLYDMKAAVYGWFNWPILSYPDVYSLRAALNERFKVTRDPKSNITTVTLLGDNPDQARRLLSKLVNESDKLVRLEFYDMATEFSKFIVEKLKSVTSLDQRASLDGLLTEYQRMETMAGVQLPFTAIVLDPPSAPATPSGPNWFLGMLEWFAAGLILGGGFVLTPNWLKPDLPHSSRPARTARQKAAFNYVARKTPDMDAF